MPRILPALGLLVLAAAPLAQAADVHSPEELFQANCVRCHGSEIYTRADRKVTSLPGLHKQVRMCDSMLGLTLFDEDINGIASMLNEKYYKFPTNP